MLRDQTKLHSSSHEGGIPQSSFILKCAKWIYSAKTLNFTHTLNLVQILEMTFWDDLPLKFTLVESNFNEMIRVPGIGKQEFKRFRKSVLPTGERDSDGI